MYVCIHTHFHSNTHLSNQIYMDVDAAVKKRQPRRKKSQRQHPDMTGRRVLVDGSYFGNPHDHPYPGIVHKWTSYYNAQMQKLWGYDVHYDAGDEYYMLEVDVVRYLIPESESTLGMYHTCNM